MSSEAVPAPEIEGVSAGSPTPIGRRLDEPRPAPPPLPPPPAAVPAPGRALRRGDTPPTGTPAVDAASGITVRSSPRLARLYVSRINPWSVMKVGFMLSVALAVVIVTAVAIIWWALDYSGVFITLARTVDEILGAGTTTFDLEALVAFERVLGASIVIAAMEIVLVSVLAGLFAILYNLTVGMTGGVEVTFSDAV
jgi:hypothetical protein